MGPETREQTKQAPTGLGSLLTGGDQGCLIYHDEGILTLGSQWLKNRISQRGKDFEPYQMAGLNRWLFKPLVRINPPGGLLKHRSLGSTPALPAWKREFVVDHSREYKRVRSQEEAHRAGRASRLSDLRSSLSFLLGSYFWQA